MLNPQNSDYITTSESTLQDAMQKITANHRGSVVVVGENMLVVGILSDGDIRRAMVKSATMFTPVEKAMNANFISISISDTGDTDTEKFFAEHSNINVVPVVDKNNKLVDVLIRGGAYTVNKQGDNEQETIKQTE